MLLFDIYPSGTQTVKPVMLHRTFGFNPLCKTACLSVKEKFDSMPVAVSDSLPFSIWVQLYEFYETLTAV